MIGKAEEIVVASVSVATVYQSLPHSGIPTSVHGGHQEETT